MIVLDQRTQLAQMAVKRGSPDAADRLAESERFETAKAHPQFQGVVVDVDPGSGQAIGIERISLLAEEPRGTAR